MLKTSIETINGELYTVILYGVDSGVKLLGYRYAEVNGVLEFFKELGCFNHIATALPALPPHSKPDDAALLYRYMAEGLYPYGLGKGSLVHADDWLVDHRIGGMEYPLELKGAHDANGNHVEIAIKGE